MSRTHGSRGVVEYAVFAGAWFNSGFRNDARSVRVVLFIINNVDVISAVGYYDRDDLCRFWDLCDVLDSRTRWPQILDDAGE